MSGTSEGSSRSTLLVLGLILVVIACGLGGMLLARHFAHAGTAAPTYPVVTEAPTSSPGASAPEVETAPLQAAPSVATAPVAAAPEVQGSTPGAHAVDGTEMAQPAAGSPGAVTEDEEIGLALRRWQTALLSNDATQIAPAYSSQVKRYFRQENVSRAYIQAYLGQEEARGSRLRTYELQKVSIEHVGRHAVDVHFVASFTVVTPAGERSGSARTLLKLHQEDGDWKIYFERDYSG